MSVVVSRRAVDAVALDGRRIDSRVASGLERRPRHRDSLVAGGGSCRRTGGAGTTARGVACATGGLQDGVSHAAGLLIKDDVFDDADFAAVCAANFRADDLTALDVFSGAGGRRAAGGRLGLGISRSNGETRCRQGCSEED